MVAQLGLSGDELVDTINLAWAWPFFLAAYVFAFGLSSLGVIASCERSNVAGAAILALLGVAIDGYLVWTLGRLVSLSVMAAIVGLLPTLLAFWSFGVLLLPEAAKSRHCRQVSKVESVDTTSGSTGAASPRSLATLDRPYSPPGEP